MLKKIANSMKKGIAGIMAVTLMVTGITGISAESVAAATSGKTGTGSYCYVKISSKLLQKPGKQYASVKIKTGTLWNIWNTGRYCKVTLRDGSGRYICTFNAKGGSKLKLGDDHTAYRIYVDYVDNPSWDTAGNTAKWKITSPSNCSIQ